MALNVSEMHIGKWENELKMPLFKKKETKNINVRQELDVRALTWFCNLKIKALFPPVLDF